MVADHCAVLGFACFHCRRQKNCSSCDERLLAKNAVSRRQTTQHTKCKWCNNFFLPLTDKTARATVQRRHFQVALVTAAALALLQSQSTPAAPAVDQVPASAASSSDSSSASLEHDDSGDDSPMPSSEPPLAAAAAAASSPAAAAVAASSSSSAPQFSQFDSPLSSPLLDALTCLLRYGYALIRATPATLALAWPWRSCRAGCRPVRSQLSLVD